VTVEIRAAVSSDVPRLVALWREMWDFHRAVDWRYESTPMAEMVMAGWIGDHLERDESLVLVAEEGEIIGYCLGMILENPPVVPWSRFGHVSELAVTQSARRRGIGESLLERAHAWFRARGCGYVEANVSVTNSVAQGFWRKRGYTDFLERLRFDFNPPDGPGTSK
jgi:ribosomal protein S18 acetylase RimI-like enzyme